MRHLGSLLAGLVVTPAVWLLLAVGQPKTSTTIDGWLERGRYDTAGLIGPVAYLAAAGLLLGLVASLRVSPVGPALAGTGYAAVYTVLFVNPLWGIDKVPDRLDLRVVTAQPEVPLRNGTLAVLAVCLLVPLVSAKRWRRWPAPAVVPGPETAIPPVPELTAGPLAGQLALPGALPTVEPGVFVPAPQPTAQQPTVGYAGAPSPLAQVDEVPIFPAQAAETSATVPLAGSGADVVAEAPDSAATPASAATGEFDAAGAPEPPADPGAPPPWPPEAPVGPTAEVTPVTDDAAGTPGASDEDRMSQPPSSPWSAPPGSQRR